MCKYVNYKVASTWLIVKKKKKNAAINEWHMAPIVSLLAILIHKAIYIGRNAAAAETEPYEPYEPYAAFL